MTAAIIDGKALAEEVETALTQEVSALKPRLGRAPGLAVVLVGENPASQVYVRSKSKRAEKCGLAVLDVKLPATVTDATLQAELKKLNENPAVDGILLQLPLPKGLNEFAALSCISPEKDVDGLHPVNQGLLLRGAPAHRACTPLGVMKLIEKARVTLGQSTNIAGLQAVVVGRSILVGKPVGLLLLEQNCSVDFCHSKTKNLVEKCRSADILVAAIGKAKFIGGDCVKPGAIVMDVGINRDENDKLCGDVNFEEAAKNAAAITPVPGGVGPMTIAMLLTNTVNAAKQKI